MGKIKNNIVTKGFSGKFGEDLVFKNVDNKTVFAKRGLITGEPTAKQTEVRNRFADASYHASGAIDNPAALQDYTLMAFHQKLKSAYIAALTDYLTEPEIGRVFTASYTGKVGDMINIKPKVAMKIVKVDVKILRADGTVVESGEATPHVLNFRYVATVANAQVAGTKLVIVAHDRLNRTVTLEQAL